MLSMPAARPAPPCSRHRRGARAPQRDWRCHGSGGCCCHVAVTDLMVLFPPVHYRAWTSSASARFLCGPGALERGFFYTTFGCPSVPLPQAWQKAKEALPGTKEHAASRGTTGHHSGV